MHLTQQQQLNQMCPPPLGPPSAAWFMNHPHHHNHHQSLQPSVSSSTVNPVTAYQNYQTSNYYVTGHPISSMHNSVQLPATTLPNSALANQNNQVATTQHQGSHPHFQMHQPSHQTQQYAYPYQQQQQPHQQHPQHLSNQQYPNSNIGNNNNQINHQQLPLAIQQPLQHGAVHQQPSPHLLQLSPHTSQPRPSPTLHQHQQPSPNYQQQPSPLNQHLTSPSLQPSPVLHHHPQQQPSPLSHHQQSTPPQHAPTPTLQHHTGSNSNMRPASVKEAIHTSFTTSNILKTEVRVLEINRRLQSRPSNCYRNSPLPSYDLYDESNWWEEFVNDFFKDDATLILFMQIDDKPYRYVLRRSLISKFFKSYFDGGVTELSINLRNSKEMRGHQGIVLECDHANIITKNILRHPKVNSAPRVVVCTEGHLTLDFVGNNLESMLIKSWKFKINLCREYIDRSITAIGLPSTILFEPTTFQGLPNSTMIYLQMCSIMEPMQEMMTQYKSTNIEPRACLKQLLFERFNFKGDDNSVKAVARKRRKRKPPASPTSGASANAAKRAKSASAPSNNISPPVIPLMNIMVVGEPSSMIAEYRDENERSITKMENSNFTPVVESVKETSTKVETSCQDQPQIEKDPIERKVEEGQYLEEVQDEAVVIPKIEDEVPLKSPEPSHSEEQNQPQQDVKLIPSTTLDEVAAIVDEDSPVITATLVEDLPASSRQTPEEPVVEKENNCSALNDETLSNSTATQSENHYNIMSSIPEDREDTCRSTSCDSIVSKLPPSSNNKNTLTSNGSSNKQNRRRSSERKETLREGLMRTSDFVVAMKDLKCEHPALWRITTGNNLLQQFEPKNQNGAVLYENTNQYAGWNPEIKKNYVGVDVKLTQHTRNQITVERLLLNFQKLEDAEAFYDKHFVIYLQIVISTALDPKFWESIECEPKHHDYFLTSRRIIEDILKRFKIKLSNKLKLSETTLKNVEKYPNLLIKPADKGTTEELCRACNTNQGIQLVTFGNRSYDLHSYKPVKVTSELSKPDDKDLRNNLCDPCLELVKLYSEVHHIGWKLYNLAREKIGLHRTKGKQISIILDECLKDEEWLNMIYLERDSLWSKVEHIE